MNNRFRRYQDPKLYFIRFRRRRLLTLAGNTSAFLAIEAWAVSIACFKGDTPGHFRNRVELSQALCNRLLKSVQSTSENDSHSKRKLTGDVFSESMQGKQNRYSVLPCHCT